MVYTKSMKIEFIPSSKTAELLVPMPKPAKAYIPDWYKDIKPTKEFKFGPNGDLNNDTGALKRCMPFFDGMTAGYIQESWTDIYIGKNENNEVTYSFPTGPAIISGRQLASLDVPDSYHKIEFTWQIHWMPKLPKGWSAMITSPSNRFELPFRSFTGIVDSDNFYNMSYRNGGNYPFYLNKDFEGIIPVGTPLYQIIPFKREEWKSVGLKYDEDEAMKRDSDVRKYIFNGYKKKYWQKKMFD